MEATSCMGDIDAASGSPAKPPPGPAAIQLAKTATMEAAMATKARALGSSSNKLTPPAVPKAFHFGCLPVTAESKPSRTPTMRTHA
eukprot:CAMPEP_0179166024 /NCGR_PEP_ID=MMETSP0796-20121207/81555_1 /TAXON_ID=73915 /ORGANISM="Pyrodinium bahamense, Strain pbaha01" /LENGTH=85 /DNA_ID=CAMNT_0020868599 /DNA_START=7 /DNA_END=264 /DNA_ORIENTATION=+